MMKLGVGISFLFGVGVGLAGALEVPEVGLVDGGRAVRVDWEGGERVMLQRSWDGGSSWEDLVGTLGRDGYEEVVLRGGTLMFRLVEVGDGGVLPGSELGETEAGLVNVAVGEVLETLMTATGTAGFGRGAPGGAGAGGAGGPAAEAEAHTWVSQPGLVRTFGAGGFERGYKLYSAPVREAEDLAALATDEGALADWREDEAQWVDLNAQTEGGSFPVLDPRAATELGVEGFSWEEPAGVFGEGDDVELPMPVRWLYVLADGSLGVLDGDGNYVGEGTVSEENPIVGRVAYWTDDESCKVNVNVAAEAVPWDTPRCRSEEGRRWAVAQPVAGEVQRYPGHPATTCLSSILYPGRAVDDAVEPLGEAELKRIYGLTPAVAWGGTGLGEFASVADRVWFDNAPAWADVASWAEAAGVPEAAGLVTVSSSAPESNVHGRPRVGLWPLHEDLASGGGAGGLGVTFSQEDAAADVATEVNETGYSFFRENPWSQFYDFYEVAGGENVRLFEYLASQLYRKLPGLGGSLADKYGGVDGAFDYKDGEDWDAEHVRILLTMLDWVRSTNLLDAEVTEPYAPLTVTEDGEVRGHAQVLPLSMEERDLHGWPGEEAFVRVPLQWTAEEAKAPMGFGRGYTISEVALVIFCSADGRLVQAGVPGTRELPYEHPARKPRFSALRGDPDSVRELEQNPMAFNHLLVGKTLRYLQVGVVIEVASSGQSSVGMHPVYSIQMVTGGAGYKGAFGRADGSDALPTIANIGFIRDGYRDHPGYAIVSQSGFRNPLTYWGAAQGGSDVGTVRVLGPLQSTVELGGDGLGGIQRELPTIWNGRGGSGGYVIHQFSDIMSRPGVELDANAAFELRNRSGRIRGIHAQKGIVVDTRRNRNDPDGTMRLEAPRNTDGSLIPIQFVIHGSRSEEAGNRAVTQVIEVAFPDAVFPVPDFDASTTNTLWGDRFTRVWRLQSHNGRLDVLRDGDVVRSAVPVHGDSRQFAGRRLVGKELWRPHPNYGDPDMRRAHSLRWEWPVGADEITVGALFAESGALEATFADDFEYPWFSGSVVYESAQRPDFVADISSESFSSTVVDGFDISIDPRRTNDWSSGLSGAADGALTGEVDPGARLPRRSIFGGDEPYFGYDRGTSFDYSPDPRGARANRQVASAGQLGSLPSALGAGAPWTALLFRPDLSGEGHLGEAGNGLTAEGGTVSGNEALPGDHAWMDLFWMPVVEPEGVSADWATQGKVNLNYRMAPFSYIDRATALHAVLKSERLLAVPTGAGEVYKIGEDWHAGWHRRVDAGETLKQWEAKFDAGEVFVTASELCEQWLYPEGVAFDGTGESMRAFWEAHRLSGDNVIERPYANVYARACTRSNSFRVHVRVEAIEKGAGTAPGRFDAAVDTVGEAAQGSMLLERRLDATREDLPDWKGDLGQGEAGMDYYYEWRVGSWE